MRDLFDDFMRELQERQRKAQLGSQPPGEPDHESDDAGVAGPTQDAGSGVDEHPGSPAAPGHDGGSDGDAGAGDRTDDADRPAPDEPEPEEPEPIGRPFTTGPTPFRGRGAGGGGGGGRPSRRPGGSGGGGDGRSAWRRLRDSGPQALLVIVGVILLAALLLVGSGLNLVTDAIWFKSVGYDAVFWTRLWAQVGLFALGLLVTLLFLLLNLWLAGRLAPRPGSGAGDRFRAFAKRLGDAVRSANETGFGGRDAFNRDAFGGRRPRGRFGPGAGPEDDRFIREERRAPELSFSLDDLPDLRPVAILILVVLAIILALGVAGSLASQWQTVLLWQNRVPFSTGATAVVDPIFQRDPSFYLFDLPFLRLVQGIAAGLLIAAFIVAGVRYVVAALAGGGFSTPVRVHLAILAGLWLLTVAAGYQLDKLELVYSTRGVAAGVSYTDQAAQFFAFDALTIVAGLVAAFLVGAAFTRWVWPLGAGVATWLLLSLLLGTVYPAVIQKFTVEPNQQAQELPYITNNINMTRQAYSIGSWTTTAYSGAAPLTSAAITQDSATFQNARLWDYRPLQTALEQIQTVRQYYQFVDVDTDRYSINGTERQVMLSARELAPELLPQAGSWVNQKIVFTHGFGLAMVPVNEVAAQGLPQLFIKDMPPVVSNGAPAITQPRIYFGERPNDWVLVDAKSPEFDYPIGSTEQSGGTAAPTTQTQTTWTGTSGIKLDSLFTRLLFAARFRDLNLLISDQVTSNTKLLMNRSLGERLNLIAPFLAYDKDPYLVVTSTGRLVYVQDAYTITDRFPNAQPFDDSQLASGSGLAGASFNYIRNSVKIVMDAYDGSMTFYVADPTDPLVRAWSGVFPTLFKPLDEMPSDLRAHLRVPEELFNVQTAMFARYHVTDPAVFYQSNDLWKVPQTSGTGDTSTGVLPTEAYYVYMRMPGQANGEFLLLQPMVPAKRPNMIAWIAARNDAPNYGQVKVFQFPDTSSIFGPDQVEARIEAEPAISSQLSLWRQGGSTVVLGNLIVIPVQDSIIYLQPIYLQSTNSPIPALTKVVVASPTNVVWGDSLGQALQLLLAGGPGPSPSPAPSPSPGVSPAPSASPAASATPLPSGGTGVLPTDLPGLIQYANDHYDAAQAALRAGDFGTYGIEIAKVKAALAKLEVLTASPGPSPSP